VKEYFRDFLLGLDYIHNFANVVHRDIKPGNLLISEDNKLKLADFGISAMQKENQEEEKIEFEYRMESNSDDEDEAEIR